MTLEHWLVYCIAAVGLSLTPGPNGLLALTHGIRFGFRPTMATAAGGVCGFLILIGLSLSGLGALLAASEQAFTVLKWLGAAYLAWLGVRLWKTPAPDWNPIAVSAETSMGTRSGQTGVRQRFVEGFVVALSNPKALIFFAAFLPQFMVPGVPLWQHFVVLGGTFALVEFVYELILAAMAGRVGPWLGRHGRWFNRVAGATFVGIAVLLTRAER